MDVQPATSRKQSDPSLSIKRLIPGAVFLKIGSRDHLGIFKTSSRAFISTIIKNKKKNKIASPFMNTKPSKNSDKWQSKDISTP